MDRVSPAMIQKNVYRVRVALDVSHLAHDGIHLRRQRSVLAHVRAKHTQISLWLPEVGIDEEGALADSLEEYTAFQAYLIDMLAASAHSTIQLEIFMPFTI